MVTTFKTTFNRSKPDNREKRWEKSSDSRKHVLSLRMSGSVDSSVQLYY